MEPRGPYLNKAQAAEYCGWTPKYFASILKDYDLPRCGPARTRYATSTLDQFMAEPEAFRRHTRPRRRRKPIRVVVPACERAS